MENIEAAYQKAKRHKGWQRQVKRIEKNKEKYLKAIQRMLIDGTYRTSKYRTRYVYEPKKRLIWILPFFPDRIIPHAIARVCMPIWNATLIQDTYSCIEGRGQHKGSGRCMEFVKRNPYALQCDISKFYPSIDHELMKRVLRQKIKDTRLLKLLDEIIDSAPGLPIGNYLSQPFGNLYLNELDHLIKQKYHIHAYLRYCDDFHLYGDKATLQMMKPIIKAWVAEHGLRLSKLNLFPTSRGVDFLGYRHFPSGKILVRKRTAKKMRRRIKRVPKLLREGKLTKDKALAKVASANGVLKHATSYHFRKAIRLDEIENEVRSYQEVC